MGELISFGNGQEEIVYGEYWIFKASEDAYNLWKDIKNNPYEYFGTGNETVIVKSIDISVNHEDKTCSLNAIISLSEFRQEYRGWPWNTEY